MNPASVAEAVTPRTRAVVLVSPNNPTGSYVKRGEADALLSLCAARELAVVSDEVFADYAFGPDPRRVASFAQDSPALTFSLGGLSKPCGLPQVKLAWLAAAGPESGGGPARRGWRSWPTPTFRRPRLSSVPRLCSAGGPSCSAPSPSATSGNLEALQRILARRLRGVGVRHGGGWSAVLRVPATESETSA